jgi:hypothetical protein
MKAVLRAFALIGVMAGTVFAAPAAHADSVTHTFAADSGDSCRFGVTRGTMSWISRGAFAATTVAVAGSLVDRPVANDPSNCNDPRYSSVTFTAYRGTAVVDTELRRVDNAQVDFRFELTSTIWTVITPIDRVVVQVCRHAPPDIRVPDYCGRAIEYRQPPLITP